MEIILFGIGALIILAGIVLGVMGEFLLYSIISSVVTAFIFFGLSKIIGNQEVIINNQQALLNSTGTTRRKEEQEPCKECGKMFDVSAKSCPYCGQRR